MKKENSLMQYTTEDKQVQIEVQMEEENIWLTQNAMAELFDTSKQNISAHIKNIFQEGELNENSVVKEKLTTGKDGKSYVTKCYSLDLIIAVGYRINSKRVARFRILKKYIMQEIVQKEKGETLKKELLLFLVGIALGVVVKVFLWG